MEWKLIKSCLFVLQKSIVISVEKINIMKGRISILDINSDYLQELTEDSFINSIFGGKPTTETSFAYDVAWVVTKGVKLVVDLF